MVKRIAMQKAKIKNKIAKCKNAKPCVYMLLFLQTIQAELL
jgi:hypothetical protein